MEVETSNDHLHILMDRSWDLFGKISEIIDEDGFSFCNHCSNHGRYCVVANSTLDEREKQHMIAIRDCIQDFHSILLSLQLGEGFDTIGTPPRHYHKLWDFDADGLQAMISPDLIFLDSMQARKSSQKRQRDEALSRLEESRMHVIERINQWPERERKLEVLEELITFLEHWNFNGKMEQLEKADEKIVKRVSSFLVNATKFAFEFAMAFAGIYSTIRFYNDRHHRKQVVVAAPVESRSIGELQRLKNDDSNIYLDVLCGRG